ncbi:MAG: NAD(P)H-hydrate epimerase [Planctomycetota bacterium]|jgi:NAD(P)H-hydrate epimerase
MTRTSEPGKHKPISVHEARLIDKDAVNRLGMPSLLLMENASRAVADVARELGERWVIFCGPGNNGGDGLAAARHLGSAAQVYLMAEPHPERCPDAFLQLRILQNAGWQIPVGELPPVQEDPDVVLIDAMFGTGLSRGLTETPAAWVQRFNECAGTKLAVDIPSGLHGDTGEVLGVACKADVTVTFEAEKHGLLAADARSWVGEVRVASLGLPPTADPR